MLNSGYGEKIDIDFKFWDIIVFFKRNALIIALFMVLGLVFSLAYYLNVEKQYAGIAQLKVLQYFDPSLGQSIAVIEASPLASKAKMAIGSDLELQKQCGFLGENQNPNFFDYLKFIIPKGAPLELEVTAYRPRPELARECISGIAAKISDLEILLLEERMGIAAFRASLIKVTDRLKEDVSIQSSLNSNLKNLLAYYELKKSIRGLEDQRDVLLQRITYFDSIKKDAKFFQVKVSELPVFPPKFGTFLLGLLVGFFVGLVIAIFREIYCVYK